MYLVEDLLWQCRAIVPRYTSSLDIWSDMEQFLHSTRLPSIPNSFPHEAPPSEILVAMSTFSSFLPSKPLSINNCWPSDPFSHLIFALEMMPGSCKYKSAPLTHTEIIIELYDTFWGPHASYFAPNPAANLPLHTSLHEV